MSVDIDLGSSVCIQQIVSGTGNFVSTLPAKHLGRAYLSHGSSGAELRFRARHFGADGNNIQIRLLDTGIVQTTTMISQVGQLVTVTLRRNGSVILATAQEVADAINNWQNPSNASQGAPLVAWAGGTSAVTALATTSLAGGLDPEIVGSQLKFTGATNASGGVFYFEQTEPLVIRQVETKVTVPSGTGTVSFKIANLTPGLEIIAAETITITSGAVSTSVTETSFGDTAFILLPRQAFIVDAAYVGTARVYARRESRFSNL